jgi:uncharacterized Zn finger protein (UPF0148 family)
MIEHGYTCRDCGAPAYVKDGKVVRSCSHTVPVIASMTAVATGEGKVSNAKKP